VDVGLEVERAGALAGRGGGIVPELRVVHREIDGVEAEAVDAAVEPEAGDIEQGVLDLDIVQVQLGLLRQEIVQIVLAAAGVPGPGGAGEDGLPVAGRGPVGFRV